MNLKPENVGLIGFSWTREGGTIGGKETQELAGVQGGLCKDGFRTGPRRERMLARARTIGCLRS